jgi:hypothetical protein
MAVPRGGCASPTGGCALGAVVADGVAVLPGPDPAQAVSNAVAMLMTMKEIRNLRCILPP